MDRWDWLIYGVAGYVAVMTLVRLMAHRRNELIEQVRQQIENAPKPKKTKKKDQEAA